MPAAEIIEGYQVELRAIRQAIHAHPELAFEEFKTSSLVAEKLAEWGLSVQRNVGRTGVVASLRKGTSGRSVGLRADMDALPIKEDNETTYRSSRDNVMHACGHDGHTTMLLGAARYLKEHGSFDGTVNFIFQPAEETLEGSQAMLADKLFERFPCDSIFGIHSRPGLKAGCFAIREGPMMAGSSCFDVIIRGRASHAARPEAGSDAIVAAGQLITMLQTVISRNVSPLDHAVLSITSINGGFSYNTLAEKVSIGGTVRTFDFVTMGTIERRMIEVLRGLSSALCVDFDFDFRRQSPPLVNHPAETRDLAEAAIELVGVENVNCKAPLLMASEDFSLLLQHRPGAYINIGNDGDKTSAPLHSGRYDFNDDALCLGAALLSRVVERKLTATV